jgi:ubiquinone/menaquinone biosynthesis C-methylase UbiE
LKTKYDKIGINYNRTRKADKYITDKLFKHLNPGKKSLYLDLGCGTGNYTVELFKKGIRIIGIDPAENMIRIARSKNSQIDWIIGTAEDTGLKDESVDGIICCLTIHHWTDMKIAFRESSRILKEDGRYVIFTSTPDQMEGYWLNHYFPVMLADSKRQMSSFEVVKEGLESTGFENIKTEKFFVSNDLHDHFLYCGKYKPHLYLNPDIRNGISSFSDLANKNEIIQGLSELAKDIDDGNIKKIIDKYENERGDYLFIICDKTRNFN